MLLLAQLTPLKENSFTIRDYIYAHFSTIDAVPRLSVLTASSTVRVSQCKDEDADCIWVNACLGAVCGCATG